MTRYHSMASDHKRQSRRRTFSVVSGADWQPTNNMDRRLWGLAHCGNNRTCHLCAGSTYEKRRTNRRRRQQGRRMAREWA